MEGNVQHVVKHVSKFDGKNEDDFPEWSSKLRVSQSLYSKPTFEIVQGSQRPSDLDNDQVTSGPAFSVVRRFEGKTREDGVGHGQNAWPALRKKLDDCLRVAVRAVHRELETGKMRSDEKIFYSKDRCRDHLNSPTISAVF